jgi:hypothetical protein
MALAFVDGCDSYAGSTDLLKKYASASSPWTWSASGGRGGGGGIVAATTGAISLTTRNGIFASSSARMLGGFWFKASTMPASAATLLQGLGSGGNVCSALQLNTSGAINTLRDTGATLATGAVNVCDNVWHWIEFNWLSSGATLYYQLHVDGTQEYSSFGGSTSATFDHFKFLSCAGVTINLDDLIFYDGDGSSFTDSAYPLGAREVTTLRPTSDSTVQFTRSTGADNYALVDEVNGDITDYVEDSVSGHTDLYGYSNLGFTPSAINAVMLNNYLQNPSAGTINYKSVCKSSATQTDGASTVAPSSAIVKQDPYYVDPATAAAWTGSGVDAALFGIKVA